MGVVVARPDKPAEEPEAEVRGRPFAFWEEHDEETPPTFPEMLKLVYEADLPEPEELEIRTQWIAGALLGDSTDFWRFVSSRELAKNEALVLRHLLRLVLLASEFSDHTDDPDYLDIGRGVVEICKQVDPRHTEKVLAKDELADKLL